MAPIRVYYDGECPFCARFVCYLRLRDSVGDPELIDLRRTPEARRDFVDRGFAPDKGMLVERDDEVYGGADAMHLLSLLSSSSARFNRLVAKLTATPASSRWTYPVLRAGRAAILLMLGRSGLEAGEGWQKAPYGFFLFTFGAFGFLHFLIYAYNYGVGLYPSSYAVGILGLALALFPLSRRLFLLLVAALAVDGVLQAPVFSNHSMLKNFLVLGILVAGLEAWLRGESWRWFVSRFAPVGRWLLLVMYFFGVFHKLNTDFLDPAVSCAAVLLQHMPLPDAITGQAWLHWPAMYGTLVIEGFIVACLLTRPLRQIGVYLGIAFHSLLALSGYAFYAPFSTLTIALHCLFLPPFAHAWLEFDADIRSRLQRARRPPGLAVLGLFVLGLVALAANGSYVQLGIMWLILPVALLALIRASAKSPAAANASDGAVLRAPGWAWPVIALFFLNGFTPYLGLKTAQSFNMFANLRLEDGRSNHLLLPNAPGPFDYLEDTVEILDPGGVAYFAQIKQRGLRLTWYDFLSRMDSVSENVAVDIQRAGQVHRNVTRTDLAAAREDVLHSGLVRRWFHFIPANMTIPKTCARDN